MPSRKIDRALPSPVASYHLPVPVPIKEMTTPHPFDIMAKDLSLPPYKTSRALPHLVF